MKVRVAVPTGKKTSSLFPILHKEVLEYDSVHIRMTIATAFDGVRGLEFRWSFADPAARKFQQASLVLLSFLMLLMLIENLRRLTVERELFVKLMWIGLALSGLFSSNPTSFALPTTPFVRLSDHILMAVYLALFRLACLVQMETIRSGRPRLNLFLLLLFLVFFLLYGCVDAAASADRAKIYIEAETRSAREVAREGIRITFHWAYIGVVGAWVALLVLRARPGKRLVVVLVFTAAGAAATWFAQIWCVQAHKFEFTLVTALVVAVVHMNAGAFLVFFMTSDRKPEYQSVGAEEQKDTALMGRHEKASVNAEEEEEEDEEEDDCEEIE
jgi:hypothetical protein